MRDARINNTKDGVFCRDTRCEKYIRQHIRSSAFSSAQRSKIDLHKRARTYGPNVHLARPIYSTAGLINTSFAIYFSTRQNFTRVPRFCRWRRPRRACSSLRNRFLPTASLRATAATANATFISSVYQRE